MKLRLRLDKSSKVIEIDDNLSDTFTVADLAEQVLVVFAEFLSSSGEFFLSLNKKDQLDDHLKIKGDCNIVSGDLIYIVRTGESISLQNVASASVQSDSNSFEKRNAPSKCGGQAQTVAHSACDLDTGQPGTSVENRGSEQQGPVTFNSIQEELGTSSEINTFTQSDQPGINHTETMETDEPVDLVVVSRCLSEPVLCREATNGTVPSLLREVYNAAEPKDSVESLCVVLHVLMLETGFTVYPEPVSSEPSKLPVEWRYTGYNKFTYTYPGCTDVSCCVTVIPTGNTVMVHGKVLGTDEATRNCTFKPREYVQSVGEDCTECYCQLAKLSRLFKDAIANPLVHDIRTAAGQVDVFGLLALTLEIKLRILSFLDVRSLLHVSQVNSELLEICKDPYLWRCLYLKNFGNRRDDNSLSQNWKEFYKQEHKARKERRRLNRVRILPPPYWRPQNPFSDPSNWIPPVPGGIIGGDYDLYPNFPSSLPGVPGRMGPRPPSLPRPRYDLIGPGPDVDPGPDPGLIPHRPGGSGRGSGRGNAFWGFGGFGPRFF